MIIPHIAPLTQVERENLEASYDAIMEKIAEMDELLATVELGMQQAVETHGNAKMALHAAQMELDRWKSVKTTAIERARNLKALITKF